MGANKRMLISYVPGEECRVAMVVDGKLEELHSERANAVSYVGNIYVGKVVNVEPGIQAAFIDFGHQSNGFLHISDLHPSYFPGADEEDTEKIGRKTPRRERPPIQQCLKRGQQVIVQVIKEGISTKGPTLTTYLSIPGRYLVMLPGMDKVGVSRKVEDEDKRREMRAQLEGIELPEGYGFILRTAGEGRPKTELKRDLAYLQRLSKDIEKRRNTGGNKPRLLYAESDLLVRSLRDVWTADVDEIVIDDEHALQRAWKFMKIVAPRASTKLLHYDRKTPLYHAYGVEDQIRLMLAREVPLPSGGSLVIDETEAMIAIDVNSGRMRNNRDAETTAYKTNQEAVEEICRQLRLRDIGGLVVCDLIDMISRSHRRQIESRFRELLKSDRASTKVLPISQFGIVEMTRQRQRESQKKVHFAPCPRCEGRGVLKKPMSVAADALRELARLLDAPQVARVEMVVSPRVAGELLSTKRQMLMRIEQDSGHQAEVRVSEDIPVDRVAFYAYRADGSDLDLEKLGNPRTPSDLKAWTSDDPIEDDWAVDMRMEGEEQFEDDDSPPMLDEEGSAIVEAARAASGEPANGADTGEGEGGRKKRRRRRRRGKGGGLNGDGAGPDGEAAGDMGESRTAARPAPGGGRGDSWDLEPGEVRSAPTTGEEAERTHPGESSETDENGMPRKKRRRRRGGRGRKRGRDGGEGVPQGDEPRQHSGESHGHHDRDEDEDELDRDPINERIEAPDSDSETDQPMSRGDSWDLDPSPPRAPRPQSDPPVRRVTEAELDDADEAEEEAERNAARESDNHDDGAPKKKRRRRRRKKTGAGAGEPTPVEPEPVADEPEPEAEAEHAPEPDGEDAPKKKSRRKRSKKKTGGGAAPGGDAGPGADKNAPPAPKPEVKSAPPPAADGSPVKVVAPKRSLYGNRRRLKPGEIPTRRDD